MAHDEHEPQALPRSKEDRIKALQARLDSETIPKIAIDDTGRVRLKVGLATEQQRLMLDP